MKKFPALAAAGLGALSVGVAAPSMAAPSAGTPMPHPKVSVSGNLEHTSMQFWCAKGTPNYIIAVRTVKMPEKTVTVSEPQRHETHTMGPLTHAKPLYIFSTINQAGKTITITVKGNTSGSSFSETGTIPATCKGLPTVQPDGTVTPPAHPGKPMPTKPHPGKPMPTKPMPGKPGPAKPGMPTPTKPVPGKPAGPKVDTDYVAPKSGVNAAVPAGLALAAVAGAGIAVARRRSN